DAQSSLTVWNASSSHTTLFIMLVTAVVFLPLVLLYSSWVYKVLWGRSTMDALKTNPDLYRSRERRLSHVVFRLDPGPRPGGGVRRAERPVARVPPVRRRRRRSVGT